MANDSKQQLQVEVKPEVSKGAYSNLALIAHSPSEVVIDFAAMLPGMQKAEVVSRVIMAPEHAKRLLLALNDNIQKYEKNFGEINLQRNASPRQGSTIAPFNMNPGEA